MQPKYFHIFAPSLVFCAIAGPAHAADIFVSGSQGAGFNVGLANGGASGVAGSGGSGGYNTSNGNVAGGLGGNDVINSTASTNNITPNADPSPSTLVDLGASSTSNSSATGDALANGGGGGGGKGIANGGAGGTGSPSPPACLGSPSSPNRTPLHCSVVSAC
jgi:hypothetical protein